MFYEVIDECFDVQLYNPSKTDASDALIDEIVDFRNEIMAAINKGKNKKDFAGIIERVEKAEDDFIDKLNKIQ